MCFSQDDGDADCFPEIQASPPPSPFLSAILAAFQPVAYDNEEDAWRCHVNQMLSDTDGSSAVYTFHVFSRLFQVNLEAYFLYFCSLTAAPQCPYFWSYFEFDFSCLLQSMQRKFGSITHSSVRFLGESLQRMGNQFLSSLEVMTSCSQCPTVLLDAETVSVTDVSISQRQPQKCLPFHFLAPVANTSGVSHVVVACLLWVAGDAEVQCAGVTGTSRYLQWQEGSSRAGKSPRIVSPFTPNITLIAQDTHLFPSRRSTTSM